MSRFEKCEISRFYNLELMLLFEVTTVIKKVINHILALSEYLFKERIVAFSALETRLTPVVIQRLK